MAAAGGPAPQARRAVPPRADAAARPRTRRARWRKLWLGILAAIGARCRWRWCKLVVLKMLPFDNKSEFQVVLDMPAGTPLEDTARVLREIGAEIAQVPEVADYQAYAGTASPINFNGLVRQYYLRARPNRATSRSTWSTRSIAAPEPRDRRRGARRARGDRAPHGGNAKVVEVPPGPPVLSPIVAEVYGPDYEAARSPWPSRCARPSKDADIVGVDDTVDEDAPEKRLLRVEPGQGRAAGRGAEGHRRGGAHGALRRGRDAGARRRRQVRNAGAHLCCRRAPEQLDALLKLPCARATASWCRCRNW
jgi:multidrug efflux pump subunit AcrB